MIAERHGIISELSVAGHGAVRLAVMMRPEFIDPDDFGAGVAMGRWLALREFAREASALAWLGGRRDQARRPSGRCRITFGGFRSTMIGPPPKGECDA
ncbi:MAG: hypothetical protein ACTHJP_09450 [Rhodanobacteraceae bacterium]